jgi:aminoglycoside phosphotransferase family enzyme/predicted kinase
VGELIDDLRSRALELVETHISWVLLGPDEVWKLKKPVDFGFLDFRALEQRRRACEAEVTLNQRLAPGVYLGVVPVTRAADGVHRFAQQVVEGQVVEGHGEVVDYAVHMRRLSDADRADLRLAEGRLAWSELEALVRRLVRFHAGAAQSEVIARFGSVESVATNVQENFAQAGERLRALAPAGVEREVEAAQLAFLRDHADDFARRIERGKIRDGHGDLRLEHVYFPPARDASGEPEPVVIDCIEFNERFRYADVCADVAFLSMDLAFHGHVAQKERLLAAYAREADDYDLYTVVDFYESYRAYVRAKVCALGLDSARSLAARERLEHDARRYLLLSLASERPPLGAPRLFAFGGLIASGKSTLAEAYAHELALPVVGSDRTRKALHGKAPTEALGAEAYSASASEAVYEEVLRRAALVLASGRSVIVDASFRARAARARVRALAQRAGARFTFVECRAPEDVLRQRLRAREGARNVSDARLDLYDDFVSRYEAVVELEPGEHVVVDTSRALSHGLAQLRDV